MNKLKKIFINKKTTYLILSFFIPIFLMVFVYFLLTITPFGEKSLLTIDMNGQYAHFLANYKNLLFSHDYSFSLTMGGNIFGLFSYYLASPLNMILLLFKTQDIAYAIAALTLLKVGLSGLTMYLYLDVREGKVLHKLLISMCYALMAYNIVNQQNIMWLDGVILLPLVALGIEVVVKKRKNILYIAALSASLITNYYIGYMICIFSVLFFAYVCYIEKTNHKDILKKTGYFLFSSVVAGLISAIILIPTAFSLIGSKAELKSSNFLFTTPFPISELPKKILPGTYQQTEVLGGILPNIYCSILAIIGAALFFWNHKINLRKKIGAFILLIIFFLSFYISPLNIIWHAFDKPAGFPYRYSFIFCFFLLSLAFISFKNMNHLKSKNIIVVCLLFIICLLFLYFRRWVLPMTLLIGWTALIILYMIFLLCIKNNKQLFNIFLFLLVSLELTYNAYQSLDQLKFTPVGEFKNNYKNNKPLITELEKQDPSWYRMEKTAKISQNEPISLQYKGLSHYSSSESQEKLKILKKMGFTQAWIWNDYNSGVTVAADSLLNVKYTLASNLTSYQKENHYISKIKKGQQAIYENPWVLPLGFGIKNLPDKVKAANCFEYQNKIYQKLSTKTDVIFTKENRAQKQLHNILEIETEEGILYKKINPLEKGYITYTIYPVLEEPLYMHFEQTTYTKGNISIKGKKIASLDIDYGDEVISLGKHPVGKEVEVQIILGDEQMGLKNFIFYYENLDILKQHSDELKQVPFAIETYNNNTLKGSYHNKTEQNFMIFTIPYDPAWKVLVDGKRVTTKKVLETFTGIELEKGKHTVEFTYNPKGSKLGNLITLITICIIGGYFIRIAWQKKHILK